MKGPGARMLLLTAPTKLFAQRFAIVLLFAGAFGLLAIAKADVQLIERFRVVANDIAAPVLEILSHPASAVSGVVTEVGHLLYLRSENERLRTENDRLLQWQAAALQIEQENAVYRSLLNTKVGDRISFITARIIGDSSGPFLRTVLLNAGSHDGVVKGQAAMIGEGLVGRIVETGTRASRILLLTDLNSRIPIVLYKSRQRAVLVGANTRLPRLQYISPGPAPRVGDRVVTSGHGGLFPPDLPIGVIAGLKGGFHTVQPYADWDRLMFVRLLRYNLPEMENEAQTGVQR